MQNTTKQTLSNLLENSSEEKEVHFNIGDEILRLNLKPDDITTTKLTWIVGAAIRSAKIEKTSEIVDLLKSLDIPNDIAEAACKYCPGLGAEITWAFYLERHGWLTASPIIDVKQLGNS